MSNLPAKRYTEEDIDAGLQAAAQVGFDQAAAETEIPRGTLASWARGKHRDRYQAIRDQRHNEEARELAVLHADNARIALHKQREAIELIDLQVLARRPETLAQTAAHLSKVAASGTDKMQVLRDRPTQIVGNIKTVDELDQAFRQRFGPKWDVESTAIEMPESDALTA